MIAQFRLSKMGSGQFTLSGLISFWIGTVKKKIDIKRLRDFQKVFALNIKHSALVYIIALVWCTLQAWRRRALMYVCIVSKCLAVLGKKLTRKIPCCSNDILVFRPYSCGVLISLYIAQCILIYKISSKTLIQQLDDEVNRHGLCLGLSGILLNNFKLAI